MGEPLAALPSAREPRWRVILCFLLTLAAIQIALAPKIRLSQWILSADRNAGVAEGVAWLHGRLDIPTGPIEPGSNRRHDTAWFHGRVYNVFPPLVGALTVILSPLHRLLLQCDALEGEWLPGIYTLLAFWPLPFLGFHVFRRETGDSAWAGLLTLAWIGGTALLPNLGYARYSHLGQLNHVLSQTGLMLLMADLFGRQRIWPALIGLLIAVWTRQMTIFYACPLLWIALRRGRLPLCIGGLVVVVAPLLVLNGLKFGNPFDFGYEYIYANRAGEYLADRAASHGLFSPYFIADNAWFMHAAPPGIEFSPESMSVQFRSDLRGSGIWFTTPLLFFIFASFRRWWGEPTRRRLMLSTLPVMLGLLCYHTTGFVQIGYNRFALDFVPIWLVVSSPATRGGRRTWIALACIAWSLLYFQAIVPDIALAKS